MNYADEIRAAVKLLNERLVAAYDAKLDVEVEIFKLGIVSRRKPLCTIDVYVSQPL